MTWFKDWFDSPYYHILYGKRDEIEAETLIRLLLKYLNPSEKSVFLDLACGKGRHAKQISALGFDTFGVDLSASSIEIAKEIESDQLHFEVHDMRETFKPNAFDYILNLFTSFGYFSSIEDNNKTIHSVSEGLKKDGVFVQDYFNAEKVKNNFVAQESKTVQGIEFNIQKHIDGNVIFKNIHFVAEGIEYRYREQVNLFDKTNFEEMYNNNNLELLTCFGDYQLNPFDSETSDRLILISKKR